MRFSAIAIVGAAVVVFGLGVVVPVMLAKYTVEGGLSLWFSVPVAIVSILGAGLLGLLGLAIPVLELTEREEQAVESEVYEEKLRAYRARQRAMLELLDEIETTLGEIKDILERGGLGYEGEEK